MIAFLKLLAAVILALIILFVLGFFLARRWIKKWFAKVMEAAQQQAAANVPPFRVRLVRRNHDDAWQNQARIDEVTGELAELGFTQIGDFHAGELMVALRAFQHHEHRVYAVAYDHFMAGVWCDFVRLYEDNQAWTYASRGDDLADRPSWAKRRFFAEESLATIFEAFLSDSPTEGMLNTGADKFVKMFETAYARESNWRITRGGVSEAEIRRVAEQQGNEVTDETVRLIQGKWRDAISQFLSERMLANWRAQADDPGDEFELIEERLVGVHPRMTPKKILGAVDDTFFDGLDLDELDAEEEDEEEARVINQWRMDLGNLQQACEQQNPISVFHGLLKEKDKTKQFRLLGKVDRPISGEIWLRPDSSNEMEEHEGVDVAEFDDIDVE